jgi:hypothetical protein
MYDDPVKVGHVVVRMVVTHVCPFFSGLSER